MKAIMTNTEGGVYEYEIPDLPPDTVSVPSIFGSHPVTQVHRCPVCEGRGAMPFNFYNRQTVASITADVMCKSCSGKGIIVL